MFFFPFLVLLKNVYIKFFLHQVQKCLHYILFNVVDVFVVVDVCFLLQ